MSNKKEETRKRIIAAAGEGIRQHGYGGIGVDGIAKGAGVTSGAIYGHFGSKDKVFEASVMAGMQEFVDGIYFWQESKGNDWIVHFIDWYLSDVRRKNIAGGCALPGLTIDVIRAGDNVHKIYQKQLLSLVSAIAKGLPQKKELKEKENIAWSLLSILLGAIAMSRAVDNEKIAKQTIASAKELAIKITTT